MCVRACVMCMGVCYARIIMGTRGGRKAGG